VVCNLLQKLGFWSSGLGQCPENKGAERMRKTNLGWWREGEEQKEN